MGSFTTFLYAHAKAFAGALAGGLTTYFTLSSDGSMTADDWRGVVIAVVAGGGLTFLVPNTTTPKPPKPVVPTVQIMPLDVPSTPTAVVTTAAAQNLATGQ